MEDDEEYNVETITFTTEELLEKRAGVLKKYNITEEDLETEDCGCCLKDDAIPGNALWEWQTWNWLLGED